MENLKVYQKTYDMIQYGYVALRQFPRSEKHTFVAETKKTMMKKRIKGLAAKVKKGEVGLDKLDSSLQSYLGTLQHCNSYNLKKKVFKMLKFRQ